jgi:hypothetical protein
MVTTDSGLDTPDRQVFMAAGETPGPSGTRPDRYFEDISSDELSTNAPADETSDDKNARRERNMKRTNGVDVSVRASPYGTSRKHLTKSKTGCTLLLNSASCLSPR